MHREVLRTGQRPGWIALGLESYLDWLDDRASVSISTEDGATVLSSGKTIRDLVVRVPSPYGWSRRALPSWTGTIRIDPASN